MTQIFNFSAGPAVLPKPVLARAQAEMLDWHGSGMSVMEMSHRGKEFTSILEKTEADLRQLLAIPTNYKVLFLQGGAIAENAMIPLNLLNGKSADYVVTGAWSKRSVQDAQAYGQINIAASAEAQGFTTVPAFNDWQLNKQAAYVHYCTNETINGVEFLTVPDTHGVPIVADMSSHILSRPIDVSKYGVIYGGAQKNIGPAGLCLVIVREDLLEQASSLTPAVFHWKTQADNQSMINTPPTYSIYIAGLVFEWLLAQGGVEAIEQKNIAKANLLYHYLDQTDFYDNAIQHEYRSRMNIPFRLHDESLNDAFLKQAETQGLLQLKGHRSVGGMRASMYNAMPIEGVQALVEFMQAFEKSNS
ncbi:3-phosphoserine/phosphohydroxythreonine transaminase [Methylophilus medardicus]|uniref:Phosphoserine aminotransferase n=1 Tax=Methylophilus medardicus TaxID=2588534 RepID=A0A5B8CSF2_9PROT|nr:3-phosphoserine/phosphohydroxythreonine transaminase [Methylophilus medardicus]QDC44232.1 3-phosphoserine/phosphohydroxythreonine transaminase [Methylophilus medardicus]QDC49239.1 3-phosphoserine/phosphohydroxythreonine transaminase [Methylophilus medardicus]QDC52944.1 3-phosphoserine/phosphohydroxythreonine transaminase [Methylophilus medardicus]